MVGGGLRRSGKRLLVPLLDALESLHRCTDSMGITQLCIAATLAAVTSDRVCGRLLLDRVVPLLVPLTDTDDEARVELVFRAMRQLPGDECMAAVEKYWADWEMQHADKKVLFEKEIRRLWLKSSFGYPQPSSVSTDAELLRRLRRNVFDQAQKEKVKSRREMKAGITLQRFIRGKKTRDHFGEQKPELLRQQRLRIEEKKRVGAATAIQVRVRGRQARKKQRQLQPLPHAQPQQIRRQ